MLIFWKCSSLENKAFTFWTICKRLSGQRRSHSLGYLVVVIFLMKRSRVCLCVRIYLPNWHLHCRLLRSRFLASTSPHQQIDACESNSDVWLFFFSSHTLCQSGVINDPECSWYLLDCSKEGFMDTYFGSFHSASFRLFLKLQPQDFSLGIHFDLYCIC